MMGSKGYHFLQRSIRLANPAVRKFTLPVLYSLRCRLLMPLDFHQPLALNSEARPTHTSTSLNLYDLYVTRL